MRAEHAVEFEVIALREQPRVELAEQRAETVRVVERARRAAGIRDAQPVARRVVRRGRPRTDPASPAGSPSARTRSAVVDDGERARAGHERAHDGARAELVRAEYGERIAFATLLDRGEAAGLRSRAA